MSAPEEPADGGSPWWRVLVDLFADDDRGDRVGRIGEAVLRELGATRHAGAWSGVDQGTGAAGRPVIGMVFTVRSGPVRSGPTARAKRRAPPSSGPGGRRPAWAPAPTSTRSP